jgi:pyrimidine-nucleoside phosphorylase
MDEPLGRSVGNALEVAESVGCLRGSGARDLMEVTYAIGVQMLLLAGASVDAADARSRLEGSISSGAALAKFREMVSAQGGDARTVDDTSLLQRARIRKPLAAPRPGFVAGVDALGVAFAALHLGAGRSRAEDPIDHAVGVDDLVKVGDKVGAGDPLCTIHANSDSSLREAAGILAKAIDIGDAPRPAARLVDEVIG